MPWYLHWEHGALIWKYYHKQDTLSKKMPRLIPVAPLAVDIDEIALADRVARLVIQKLLEAGISASPIPGHSGGPGPQHDTMPSVELDSSLLDVGVDTAGLQKSSSEPIGTQTKQGDSLGTLRDRLKELKKDK